MANLNVLMIVRDSPRVGGLERVIAYLAMPLRAEGVSVSALVVPGNGRVGRTRSFLEDAMPVYEGSGRDLDRYLSTSHVVHVHAQDCLGWPRCVPARSRRLGVPTLMTVHLAASPPLGAWSLGRVRVTAHLLLLGLSLRAVQTALVTPSADSARDLRKRLGPWTRVSVLPNGVPDQGIAPPPMGPFRAVFVGNLDRQKGADTFVDGVLAARTLGAKVIADVVGDGPLRSTLESRARCAAGAVRFHGWLADPSPIIRNAHVLVVTARHEAAVPLVAMEAAALGRGIVARAGLEGFTDEWTEATAFVDAAARPDDFAAALVELAAQPLRVAALASAARTAYESNATLDVAARAWAASYRSLARR